MSSESPLRALLLLTFTWLALESQDSRADDVSTVWVAANGTDDPACGAKSRPCRSISAGIANASRGDKVMVGPGKYGELNFDGDFTDPGEEQADPDSGCIICIQKSVRLLSTDGADVTVIESLGDLSDPRLTNTVLITADGAVFGSYRRGFTFVNPKPTALRVRGAAKVSIVGNVAVAGGASQSGVGFEIDPGPGTSLVADNVASHFVAANFFIGGPGQVHFIGNTAVRGSGNGFAFGGRGHFVARNSAANNITGFVVGCTACVVTGNVSSANLAFGMQIANDGSQGLAALQRNTIVGNAAGIQVRLEADARINNNDIYGNEMCGVRNESARVIDATGNYWGAATGPGPDPADQAGPGSACDFAGSVTIVAPFRSAPK